MKIRTKRENFRCWERGDFGNKPRTWPDATALAASGYTGKVSIRSRSMTAAPTVRYYVPVPEALALAADWPGGATFSEAMPDDRLLLQGEIARLVDGLTLRYDTARNTPMREAMKHARHAYRIVALEMLRAVFWPSSFDDAMMLLDRYPDAVIEFNAFECAIGTIPFRNVVIWEVRNY